MNLQEQFYQAMTNLRSSSRAASIPEARVTEMINGIIVTRPLKKIEEVEVEAKQTTATKEAQPQVWNLTPQGPVLEE